MGKGKSDNGEIPVKCHRTYIFDLLVREGGAQLLMLQVLST